MRLTPAPHAPVAGPVVVAVMDGVGIGPGDEGDAVSAARTPFLNGLAREKLYTSLRAHGLAVGLANDGEMGNSEVGHNALGSGQIIAQGARRVADAIANGTVFQSESWQRLVAHLTASGGALHLIGLLSDGNIHGHIDHAIALATRAAQQNLPRCYLHVLLDGRDVPRTSALVYIDRLEAALAPLRAGGMDCRIVSGGGRMRITMDRYGADWPMVERGWRCHVQGRAPSFPSARAAVQAARAATPGIGDQDLPAFVVAAQGGAQATAVHDGDAVVAFNFRGDRMLQWVDAFEHDDFAQFDRGHRPDVLFVGMTQYDGDTQRPKHYLVQPPHIANTFGEALAHTERTQLAVSETQKFGHVTYFWNGNRSGAFAPELERYEEVPSGNAPFAQAPAMQADAIAQRVCAQLREQPTDFCRLNLANGDMVGHTGNFDATVAAIEAVDRALSTLARCVVAELRGALVVTADHGNAEDMAERGPDGRVLRDAAGRMVAKTSHSLHPVPFGIVLTATDKSRFSWRQGARAQAGLANVAATCATLMGLNPLPMWEPSLIEPATPRAG